MRGIRSQHCVDCHFFVKEARDPRVANVSVVSREERVQARAGDYSWHKEHYAIACNMKVWDEGYNFDGSQKHAMLTAQDRRNFCFFWEHHPGMLLPAAQVLQEREAREREARRDRRLTICGLWIAALALLGQLYAQVGQLYAQVAQFQKWWPFVSQ